MAKIVIDAGHAGGNTDPGAINPVTGLQEADVTLEVSKLVAHYLECAGYPVKLTRSEREQPETDSLQYRCDIANKWDADVFLSLHCNSAGTVLAKGFEVWTSPGQTDGDQLATYVQQQIVGEFPDRIGRVDYLDGDPDKESHFYVLTQTNAPACLVEMAFISSSEEAALLSDPIWQDRMARAVARGVTDYLAG
ncbi:MAG: cell wall hydrolase/autolysin [Firmicutes bacterium]|nr:cell wall hydrolase/autolysin [Bacillota bacterium]